MDQAVFTQQVLEMEYSLYRIAKTLLRQDADCADAVQEALLNGFKGAARLRDDRYFKTWMTRILLNVCKDMLKKRARTPLIELPETLPAPDETQRRELYQALHAIREELRLPLVLHYLEGLTVKEVSGVLRVPQGTIKHRLCQGKNELSALLRGDEEAV